ncbi:S8/S53 family peptidase [Aquabacterium humicola]|uniref:S8/S53 family peptidase n=1 Tax=Aquabacterium humicola TaxID=3237377 RepID=UPI002542BCA6|nr:S8/S53 family peptidase [Rubrivivax pictus]
MRQHQVLELDARGIAHASTVLATYLPAFSLGLQPITARRLLVPGSTLDALAIEYGGAHVPAILAAAGAVAAQAVDDSGAIALLRLRDRPALPARPTPAPVAGVDWHLDAINAPAAWAMLGGAGAIAWGGVRVGHIDTGYTRHPAFGFTTGGGGTNAWLDTAQAQTFFAAHAELDDPGPGGGVDPLAFSMDGHGTRTAATICGFAPNAAGGAYFGVAPKVPLVPVRIANHVWINHAQEQFAQAVDHLIDRAGVAVISLSMGIFLSAIRRRLRRALDKAYERGVIVVCAAGNVVQDVVAPARLNRTLAIGGVTRLDGQLKPWSGSSHGPEVEWSGPAEGIRRAESRPDGSMVYSGGGDGTSYATAMTAGAAALWLARHGDAALATQYPLPWQRIEAFKALARQTVRVPPGWQPGSFGDGVLDVAALLAAPLPAAAATPDAQA